MDPSSRRLRCLRRSKFCRPLGQLLRLSRDGRLAVVRGGQVIRYEGDPDVNSDERHSDYSSEGYYEVKPPETRLEDSFLDVSDPENNRERPSATPTMAWARTGLRRPRITATYGNRPPNAPATARTGQQHSSDIGSRNIGSTTDTRTSRTRLMTRPGTPHSRVVNEDRRRSRSPANRTPNAPRRDREPPSSH